MAKFEKLLDDEEIDVPTLKTTVSTVKTNDSKSKTDDHESKTDDSKKTKKNKKSTGNVDEVLKSLMNKNKKETARLGLTVNKEIYDKLKTLSMTSSKSVTKVVSELLEASLAKVEIDCDLVEAFDENFKEKRKK